MAIPSPITRSEDLSPFAGQLVCYQAVYALGESADLTTVLGTLYRDGSSFFGYVGSSMEESFVFGVSQGRGYELARVVEKWSFVSCCPLNDATIQKCRSLSIRVATTAEIRKIFLAFENNEIKVGRIPTSSTREILQRLIIT